MNEIDFIQVSLYCSRFLVNIVIFKPLPSNRLILTWNYRCRVLNQSINFFAYLLICMVFYVFANNALSIKKNLKEINVQEKGATFALRVEIV